MIHEVLICGATGYVGCNLAAHLQNSGLFLRCLVRPGANAGFLHGCGAQIIETDIQAAEQGLLREAFQNVDTVVHLVGSVAPTKGQTFTHLHRNYTERLVNLCLQHGVPKVVMVTTLGANNTAQEEYFRSKWLAEQVLINSGLKYVILRPSLIYGKLYGTRDSKLVRRYIELIETRPRVPLIESGKNRVQPIFIGDLLKCIELAITGSSFDNHCFDLAGSEVITLKEFVGLLMLSLDISKSFVNLPAPVARGIAAVCEMAQAAPLLSREQVKLALIDNVCQGDSLKDDFGVTATLLREGLRTYAMLPEAQRATA